MNNIKNLDQKFNASAKAASKSETFDSNSVSTYGLTELTTYGTTNYATEISSKASTLSSNFNSTKLATSDATKVSVQGSSEFSIDFLSKDSEFLLTNILNYILKIILATVSMFQIRTLFVTAMFCLVFSNLCEAQALAAANLSPVTEDDVTFSYASNDGEINLSCAHVYDNPKTSDWDVWCGKGTNMLKIFRVHFLLREYKAKTSEKMALQVLYLVNDRNKPLGKGFSSSTQWMEFAEKTSPEKLIFSLGVENDYATLKLEYKAHR